MSPVEPPIGSPAPPMRDHSALAAFLVLSLALWAIPLLVYAHQNSGQSGGAELPNIGSMLAKLIAVGLLLLCLPAALFLLERMRYGYAFGVSIGVCSVLFAVIASIGGFYKLGSAAVLALLHCSLAGAAIVALLVRTFGRELSGIGRWSSALEADINSGERPVLRHLAWGLLALAFGLAAAGALTDRPARPYQRVGVPQTAHAWVLLMAAALLGIAAAYVIKKNRR